MLRGGRRQPAGDRPRSDDPEASPARGSSFGRLAGRAGTVRVGRRHRRTPWSVPASSSTARRAAGCAAGPAGRRDRTRHDAPVAVEPHEIEREAHAERVDRAGARAAAGRRAAGALRRPASPSRRARGSRAQRTSSRRAARERRPMAGDAGAAAACPTARRAAARPHPPSESPSRDGRGAAGSPAARRAARARCSRPAPRRSGPSGWKSDARYWICPRPDAELELAAAVHADAVRRRSSRRPAQQARRPPKRDGLTLTICGGNGSASMSATSGSARPR